MNIKIEEVKDITPDTKLYVQDKDGFIDDLLHDWGDYVTIVTENGKHIDFDKSTVLILTEDEVNKFGF